MYLIFYKTAHFASSCKLNLPIRTHDDIRATEKHQKVFCRFSILGKFVLGSCGLKQYICRRSLVFINCNNCNLRNELRCRTLTVVRMTVEGGLAYSLQLTKGVSQSNKLTETPSLMKYVCPLCNDNTTGRISFQRKTTVSINSWILFMNLSLFLCETRFFSKDLNVWLLWSVWSHIYMSGFHLVMSMSALQTKITVFLRVLNPNQSHYLRIRLSSSGQ